MEIKSLKKLCTLLNRGKIIDKDRRGDMALAGNDKGVEFMDFSALPTFGGDEPTDTLGIYSWDEKNILINLAGGGFAVVSRKRLISPDGCGRVSL